MSSRADNRTLSYAEAVFEATRSEMARDPSVFVMGQGVDDARGMFGTTLGLHKEFGPERSFDVPLAEDAMTGVGIGAALMTNLECRAAAFGAEHLFGDTLRSNDAMLHLARKSGYAFAASPADWKQVRFEKQVDVAPQNIPCATWRLAAMDGFAAPLAQ